MTTTLKATQQVGPWIVLNCHVTQVLGHYPTEAAAVAAAAEFGKCSFAYKLSETERAAMTAA